MKILNNSIQLIFQPQSSIGKRYIAGLLKQYLKGQGGINYFSIQKKNVGLWDELFNKLFKQQKSIFIIIVSSSCFAEFTKYLKETKILKSIENLKTEIFNHYIFTPGRNGEGVKKTLRFISKNMKKRSGKNVVWENDNLGTTIRNYTKGRFSRLKEIPEFKEIEKDISTTINLPAETYLFQKDLSSHILTGKTFDHAIYNSKNNLILRQRLYQIKKRTFEAIKNAGI